MQTGFEIGAVMFDLLKKQYTFQIKSAADSILILTKLQTIDILHHIITLLKEISYHILLFNKFHNRASFSNKLKKKKKITPLLHFSKTLPEECLPILLFGEGIFASERLTSLGNNLTDVN